MVPELGVLSAPAIELLCTAGPGPSTIVWASALVALCSSLEGFVITHVALPSWSFISFPSSSLPSYYFTTTSFFFLYLSMSWITDAGTVSPRGAPFGTGIPTWKAAHVRLRKTCCSSTEENLMLLENSLQHLRMRLQIHRKWED